MIITTLFLPRLRVKMMPIKKMRDFSTFLPRNNFGKLKKPVPDKLKITIHMDQKNIKIKVVHLQWMGNSYSSSDFTKFRQIKKLWEEKWLFYSPYWKAYYCFVCFLFSKNQLCSNFSKEGYSKWRKLNPRITNHETSPSYRECMKDYLNFVVPTLAFVFVGTSFFYLPTCK